MTLRDYIGDGISIDGRMICYRLVTACDYLEAKGMTEAQIDQFQDEEYGTYELISQIMAIKQSCFLLRRVSHSCQSLSDGLYQLKLRLIRELQDDHGFFFDDEFVERDGDQK